MKQLLKVPEIRSVAQDKAILNKGKKKSPTSVKGGGGIASRIDLIVSTVTKYLGKYEEFYKCVQAANDLNAYIDQCISDGICAIDTETTGIDPLVDDIVGFSVCCPTYRDRPIYVPLNHISYVTGQKVANQIAIEIVKNALERLRIAGTKIVMFNAVFDCRVIKNTVGVLLKCYWDCSVASRCMNENEPKGFKGLKKLHQKYVLGGKEDAFKYDDLFEGLCFNIIPIRVGSLYAAHDAKITLEFYEYQNKYLYYDREEPFEARNGMNGVSWVFFNIEMPIVEVDVELEDTGVKLDLEYCAKLKVEYTEKLKVAKDKCYKIIDMYADDISRYRGDTVLDNPINLGSAKQLAVLFYDIMGEKLVDKDKPRGTGEKILKKMNNPLSSAILEYRAIEKLMNTYIDKMPNCMNKKDGRVHCKFNQYGADTGRFSSQDPNLQNIPSKNHDIRKMFVATTEEYTVQFEDEIIVDLYTEIETNDGWKYSDEVKKGDVLKSDDGDVEVDKVEVSDKVHIFVKEVM